MNDCLQEPNGKNADKPYLVRQTHLQIPNHWNRQAQYDNVGTNVEGAGEDVRENLIPAAPAWNRLVPVECKWSAEQEAAEDDAQTPEYDENGCDSRCEAEGRDVKDPGVEEENGDFSEHEAGCPEDLYGEQILYIDNC